MTTASTLASAMVSRASAGPQVTHRAHDLTMRVGSADTPKHDLHAITYLCTKKAFILSEGYPYGKGASGNNGYGWRALVASACEPNEHRGGSRRHV